MELREELRRHLHSHPVDQPIAAKTLHGAFGPPEAVDAALDALVTEGTLWRALPGIYGLVKETKFGRAHGFGAWEAMGAWCEATGHRFGRTELVWANHVGLSTQMQAKEAFLTDAPTQDLPFGEHGTIHLRQVDDGTLRLSQSVAGGAVLGFDVWWPEFPLIALLRLRDRLKEADFTVFLREAKAHGGTLADLARAYEDAQEAEDPAWRGDALSRAVEVGFSEAFLLEEVTQHRLMPALQRVIAAKKAEREEDGHES